MINFTGKTAVKNIWNIYGSFGSLSGDALIDGKKCKFCGNGYVIEDITETDEGGVAYQTGDVYKRQLNDRAVVITDFFE